MIAPHRCDLRHTVVLEREARTGDGGGGYVFEWLPVATLRANVAPLEARERAEALQGRKLTSATTHRVTIRHRADVTAAMRLRFRGRLFNIRAVVNLGERDRWLVLMCEEGVAT